MELFVVVIGVIFWADQGRGNPTHLTGRQEGRGRDREARKKESRVSLLLQMTSYLPTFGKGERRYGTCFISMFCVLGG